MKKTLGRKFRRTIEAYRSLFKDEKDAEDDGYTEYSTPKTVFKDDDLGVEIMRYDVSINPGYGFAMLYEKGLLVKREDGTIAKGICERWRNSSHVWPSIKGTETVVLDNERLMANVNYSDGSTEMKDLGNQEVSKAYIVFRENYSYNQFMQFLEEKIFQEDLLIDCIITKKGTDIIETEDVKNIPLGSYVISDAAAIEACPSLSDKNIIRIDDLLQESFGPDTSFGLKISATYFTNNPSEITIFKPCCADHPEEQSEIECGEQSEEIYVNYLKKKLSEAYGLSPESVSVTSDPDNLIGLSSGHLTVIDRHASHKVDEDVYKRSLKLPLYENFSSTEDKNKRLHEQFASICDYIFRKLKDE